jgi:hypothetical protein
VRFCLGVSYTCLKMAVIPDSQLQPSSMVPSDILWKFVMVIMTMASIPPSLLRYGVILSGCPGVTCAPTILASSLSPCWITNPAVPNLSLYDPSHTATALPTRMACAMYCPFSL